MGSGPFMQFSYDNKAEQRMIQAQVMRLEASCMLLNGMSFNELLVNCEAETDLTNDDDNEIEEDDGTLSSVVRKLHLREKYASEPWIGYLCRLNDSWLQTGM